MSFFPSLPNKEPNPKVQFEKRLSDDIPEHWLTIYLIIPFLYSENSEIWMYQASEWHLVKCTFKKL